MRGAGDAVRSRSGRYIRTVPFSSNSASGGIAVDATIRAAALRAAGAGEGRLRILGEDLRAKVRESRADNLILFLVDSSDSMRRGAYARMRAAKGAVMALLRGAYRRRDKVALIAFRDREATVVLQPTGSVSLAGEALRALPTGGATPLGDALAKALELVRNALLKHPGLRPFVVLISDGEATVPLHPGLEPLGESLRIMAEFRQRQIELLLLDTKPDAWFAREPTEMKRLADAGGGEYRCMGRIRAATVVKALEDTVFRA